MEEKESWASKIAKYIPPPIRKFWSLVIDAGGVVLVLAMGGVAVMLFGGGFVALLWVVTLPLRLLQALLLAIVPPLITEEVGLHWILSFLMLAGISTAPVSLVAYFDHSLNQTPTTIARVLVCGFMLIFLYSTIHSVAFSWGVFFFSMSAVVVGAFLSPLLRRFMP